MTQTKVPAEWTGKTDRKEDEEDETLTMCGIGSWRPKFLQRFATPVWFLVSMSLVGVIQSSTGPLYFSTISTLEKRYAFDSKVSAIILIADNFSQMLVSPLVGYLGVRYNRARLIGIGELCMAASCFICALPYFIYGPALHFLDSDMGLSELSGGLKGASHMVGNGNGLQMCQLESNVSSLVGRAARDALSCSNGSGNTVWLAVILLVSGSFFRGIGFSCYFVIGLPYLDDNVSRKSSPMFMSISQSIRLIGPAGGFMLSSLCLRFFEDPFLDPGFGRSDPRFIGAWWLPFIIVGVLLFVASLPMLLFPFQFKTASVKASTFKKEMKQKGGSWSALKRFFKNPVVMLYCCGSIFRYSGIGGYVIFKTKYIESQFRQSSSAASFITGSTSIMPMAIGIVVGGALLTFFRPRPRFIMIYIFIVEGLSIFTFGAGMFIGCSPLKMGTGLGEAGPYSMGTGCNQNCGCGDTVYTPFCGPDGKTTYFSPCHAGCTSYNAANKTAWDCSCFDGMATKGYCPSDTASCNNLMTYLLVILFGAIVSATARTANSLISFRTVEPMDKGFTIGCMGTLMAIFSFIPYPIIFGWVIESACLVFEKKCGKTGNCWFYDQTKFRQYLHGTSVLFMIIGSIFDFILIFYSDRIKDFYGDEAAKEEEEEAKNGKAIEHSNTRTNDLEMKSPKTVMDS